jgi:predicted metal-dependent HD superfamily phosphohydrolase
MNRTRWDRLMTTLTLPESNESFDKLVNAYSEKHRHYHTVARRNLAAAIATLRGK